MVGSVPDINKAVFIAAPHTSNWDGFWLIIYKVAVDVDVRFLGKHTIFWWPLGSLLRFLGATPIDRSDSSKVVPQLVETFAKSERFFLALSPEGTRKWMPYWKTGFYRIAKAANVPIVLAHIDYRKKEIGIGPILPVGLPLPDILLEIREYYADRVGRKPELQGPVKFPPD